MMSDLTDKIALVTGASIGVGHGNLSFHSHFVTAENSNA